MQATIIVQMDNDAFTTEPGCELARILTELAEAVGQRDWRTAADVPPLLSILHDYNGNSVGRFTISKTHRRTTREAR